MSHAEGRRVGGVAGGSHPPSPPLVSEPASPGKAGNSPSIRTSCGWHLGDVNLGERGSAYSSLPWQRPSLEVFRVGGWRECGVVGCKSGVVAGKCELCWKWMQCFGASGKVEGCEPGHIYSQPGHIYSQQLHIPSTSPPSTPQGWAFSMAGCCMYTQPSP